MALYVSPVSEVVSLTLAGEVQRRHEDARTNRRGLVGDAGTCNGLLIKEFANKYRSNPSATGKSQKVFAFINANGTKETKLCIAAATSNEKFSKVKSELFGRDRETVQDISWNDLRITSFAKKHGNAEFHI